MRGERGNGREGLMRQTVSQCRTVAAMAEGRLPDDMRRDEDEKEERLEKEKQRRSLDGLRVA